MDRLKKLKENNEKILFESVSIDSKQGQKIAERARDNNVILDVMIAEMSQIIRWNNERIEPGKINLVGRE